MVVYMHKSTFDLLTFQMVEVNDGDFSPQVEISSCFKLSRVKTFIYYTLAVLTVGALPILARAFPRLYAGLKFRGCNLKDAAFVLVRETVDSGGEFHLCPVKEIYYPDAYSRVKDDDSGTEVDTIPLLGGGINSDDRSMLRVLQIYGRRYIYDHSLETFVEPKLDLRDIVFAESTKTRKGLHDFVHRQRLIEFGANEIAIFLKSKTEILLEELSHPFYAFQEFAILIWVIIPGYNVYAACVLLVTLLSLWIAFGQSRRFYRSIKQLVRGGQWLVEVRVIRQFGEEGETTKSFICGSSGLVPGDIVEITGRMTVPCDMLLIDGGEVEVDESTMTGDTTPALKESAGDNLSGLVDELLDPNSQACQRHMIVGGTRVLSVDPSENSDSVCAVVIHTGFQAVRGHLVRSALLTRRAQLPHEKGAFQLVIFMFVMFSIGAIIVGISLRDRFPEKSAWNRIALLLALVCTAVPPVVPAALALGIVNANRRLKRRGVYGTVPKNVVTFGKTDCILFDKTGTLTSYGVRLYGFKSMTMGTQEFSSSVETNCRQFPFHVLQTMAMAHSLKFVRQEFVGDPLEKSFFDVSGYKMRIGNQSKFRFSPPSWLTEKCGRSFSSITHKVYPFSAVERMASVIVETKGRDENGIRRIGEVRIERKSFHAKQKIEVDFEGWFAYCKGAPDAVLSRCEPNTIPFNATTATDIAALQGYRIIACAYKKLKDFIDDDKSRISSREEAENGLTFLGLFLIDNPLNVDSPEVVKTLYRANIRSVMVTGDISSAAIAVARDCYIIYPRCGVLVADTRKVEGVGEVVSWNKLGLSGSDQRHALQPVVNYQELVLTGPAFELLRTCAYSNMNDQSLVLQWQALLCRVRIFAQMLPRHKALLARDLESLGHTTVFVGDGSNDSLGFTASSGSLALSELRIAYTANFVTQEENIGSLVNMIQEGRATLFTTILCFKFVMVSSFIQYEAMLVLYYYSIGGFTTEQLVWSNVFIIVPFAIIMALGIAHRKISRSRPPDSMLSKVVLLSVFGQVIIQALMLIAVVLWTERVTSDDIKQTSMAIFSDYQLLIAAAVFNVGRPFRGSVQRNVLFVVYFALIFSANTFFLFYSGYNVVLSHHALSTENSFVFLGFAFCDFVLSFLYERLITSFVLERRPEIGTIFGKLDQLLTRAPHRDVFLAAKNEEFHSHMETDGKKVKKS